MSWKTQLRSFIFGKNGLMRWARTLLNESMWENELVENCSMGQAHFFTIWKFCPVPNRVIFCFSVKRPILRAFSLKVCRRASLWIMLSFGSSPFFENFDLFMLWGAQFWNCPINWRNVISFWPVISQEYAFYIKFFKNLETFCLPLNSKLLFFLFC